MFYISVFVVLSVLSCSTIHLIKTANSLTNGTKHTVSSSVPQPTGNCFIVKGCLSCLTSPLLVLISSAHGAASKLWLDSWLFSVWQEHLHLRKTQLPLSQSFLFSVGRCLLPSAGQHWHVTHLLTLFLCSDLLFSFSLYLFHLIQFNRQNINIITILIHLIPEPSCTGSIRHSLYQFHFIPLFLFLLLSSSLLNK